MLADAETRKSQGWEFVLTATYVEIYNEKIRDLLDPSKDNLQASLSLLLLLLSLQQYIAFLVYSSSVSVFLVLVL